jgi:hypothetical protein
VIAFTIIGIISLFVALLLLIRTGRIIANQNDQLDCLITSHNIQLKSHRDVSEKIDHALDCLLIADYKAASTSSGRDATN